MTTTILTMLNRRWLPFLIVGMVVDLAISGMLAWLGITTLNNADKANRTAAEIQRTAVSQYQACLNANQSRSDEKQLWRALFSASIAQSSQSLTPAERAKVDQEVTAYLAIIDRTFAPLNCTPPSKR